MRCSSEDSRSVLSYPAAFASKRLSLRGHPDSPHTRHKSTAAGSTDTLSTVSRKSRGESFRKSSAMSIEGSDKRNSAADCRHVASYRHRTGTRTRQLASGRNFSAGNQG